MTPLECRGAPVRGVIEARVAFVSLQPKLTRRKSLASHGHAAQAMSKTVRTTSFSMEQWAQHCASAPACASNSLVTSPALSSPLRRDASRSLKQEAHTGRSCPLFHLLRFRVTGLGSFGRVMAGVRSQHLSAFQKLLQTTCLLG